MSISDKINKWQTSGNYNAIMFTVTVILYGTIKLSVWNFALAISILYWNDQPGLLYGFGK